MSSGRIRFGLLCQGPMLRRWEAACVSALRHTPGVELALIVQRSGEVGLTKAPRGERRRAPSSHASIARLLCAMLALRARALERTDCGRSLAAVPTLTCTRHGLSSGALAHVRDQELDFVLRLGFTALDEGLISAARHGVWSYDHDPLRPGDAPPLGFSSIRDDRPVTCAVLRRLTDVSGAGVPLRRGWFQTDFGSLAETCNRVLMGGAEWPAHVCRALQRGESAGRDAPSLPAIVRHTERAPGGRDAWRVASIMVRARVGQALAPVLRQSGWNIGVAKASVGELVATGAARGVAWLPARPRHYAADPFAVSRDGHLHVFYEEYSYRYERGVIAHIALAEGSPCGSPRVVFSPSTHTSYPYLLEHEGETYLVPETSNAGEVALYRAHDFPYGWRREATLLRGAGFTDSTIVRHGDRWWLFCTLREAGQNLNLFIWHADALHGPWRPHADNPVKTDVRSARPAGRPWVQDGQLYRPAQDCSRVYGGAVVVNRVRVLHPDRFDEELVGTVSPEAGGGYPDGVHTLCPVGNVTLIDGDRRALVGAGLRGIAARRLRRWPAAARVARGEEP